jgi:hypothetical protein
MSSKRRTIQATKNYRLFHRHVGENRPLEVAKRKDLIESMKRHGYLPCFPIVVSRDKNGRLIVKEGQHRLGVAEELGLAVHWVEEDTQFDVAEVNMCNRPWTLKDYAYRWSSEGKKDYGEGVAFADRHDITILMAFQLLAGTTTFANIKTAFKRGEFKVKDREWAEKVAQVYARFKVLSRDVRNMQFVQACMSVCRVPEFDIKRMLNSAEHCREKLVRFGTADAYLDMLEEIYNFRRGKLFPLKINARMAMRERNPATKGKPETVVTPSTNGVHLNGKHVKAKGKEAALASVA